MIDTREELVAALREASEIEHGLMIQYLFSALSMKKRSDEGMTASQQAMARIWEGEILDIAVSEMGHFGTVCNLLLAVGAGPHFDRPPFPLGKEWYPFPFNLRPFSEEALYDFQIFELPRGVEPPPKPRSQALMDGAPDQLAYSRVGELYELIAGGFARIPEKDLFIGDRAAQAPADPDWSVTLGIRQVFDRDSALKAIAKIIIDGEGTPSDDQAAHYRRFTEIRAAHAGAGYFDAARAVVTNPQTRDWRGAGEGTRITHAESLKVAELFNGAYALMLHLLHQYFAYGGETHVQREALRSGAARLMSTAIRPLSEVLTELPAGDPADPARAGPTFELYGPVEVSPFLPARWEMLFERFRGVEQDARELKAVAPRIGPIGETVSFIRRALEEAALEAVR